MNWVLKRISVKWYASNESHSFCALGTFLSVTAYIRRIVWFFNSSVNRVDGTIFIKVSTVSRGSLLYIKKGAILLRWDPSPRAYPPNLKS